MKKPTDKSSTTNEKKKKKFTKPVLVVNQIVNPINNSAIYANPQYGYSSGS